MQTVRHIDKALVRDGISSLADTLCHLLFGEAKESHELPRFEPVPRYGSLLQQKQLLLGQWAMHIRQ